jgi:Zn-dependent peptidase ImmA (M78 family)
LFTLAHELGHIYMDHRHTITILDDDQTAKNKKLQEVRANVFAASFLMPKQAVHELLRNINISRDKDITKHVVKYLCIYFGSSYPAMVYRLHNLNYFDSKKRDALLGDAVSIQSDEEAFQRGTLPDRYYTLVLEAYRSMRISIGKLADFLRTDVYDARKLVKELGIQQSK